MQMKDKLAVPFELNNYNDFISNFFKEVDKVPYQRLSPNASFSNCVEYYTIHGTYCDDNGDEIIILSVKIVNNSNARVAQRNFVSHLLTNEFNNFSAAMVAYYDEVRNNWKLSFVTVNMKLGENGIELVFKPAKRFSFLVGENEPTKTYVHQLSPIYNSSEKPLLETIENAFSIGRLSKDFYIDYKNKFFDLYDILIKDNDFCNESKKLGFKDYEKFAITFSKKTLGQIVFLFFLQKKGWMGVHKRWGDGDNNYLINCYKKYQGNNFFNDVLEPLFYNALNKKRPNDTYLGVKIPFLNGGLFSPIKKYNWENTCFNIPNSFWVNGKDGLLEVLSNYNFTVDESDPDEQEIAIDPEMLGKIFESLLDVNDRASLGAFYTPREVVHYMVVNVLSRRISNQFNLKFDEIYSLLRYKENSSISNSIIQKSYEIDQFLDNIKIVDPAVGSGAFLVGLLNEITNIRLILNKYLNVQRSSYTIKYRTIRRCLHGVDIEYDAVEICKLRLWLSLIVDEELIENCSPAPLPNLNYNLCVGNSLVDSVFGVNFNDRIKLDKRYKNKGTAKGILNEIFNLKDIFFETHDPIMKNHLMDKINEMKINYIKEKGIEKDASNMTEIINFCSSIYTKDTKPFFFWGLEFNEVFESNDGFDIVIANPPYVGEDGNKEIFEPIKNSIFGKKYYQGKMDLLYFFFHLAMDISNKHAEVAFITTNYYITADGAKKLRQDLKERTNILEIINFNEMKVFDSARGQHNMITFFEQKNSKVKECKISDMHNGGNLFDRENASLMDNLIGENYNQNIQQYYISNNELYYSSNNYIKVRKDYDEGSLEERIINKIEESKKKMSDFVNINQGVVPGAIKVTKSNKSMTDESRKLNDGIFVLDLENPRDKFFIDSLDNKEKELLVPFFKNSDIRKYNCNTIPTKMLIYITSSGLSKEEYPKIFNHLSHCYYSQPEKENV